MDARYERRSLLVTSDHSFAARQSVFPDEAMTVAVIERLVHYATILEMNVESDCRRTATAPRRSKTVRAATSTATVAPPRRRALRHPDAPRDMKPCRAASGAPSSPRAATGHTPVGTGHQNCRAKAAGSAAAHVARALRWTVRSAAWCALPRPGGVRDVSKSCSSRSYGGTWPTFRSARAVGS